jgi:hypothetical protein
MHRSIGLLVGALGVAWAAPVLADRDNQGGPPPAATDPTPPPAPAPIPTPEPAPAPSASTPPPAATPPTSTPPPSSVLTTAFGGATAPKDKPVAAPPKDAPFVNTERHKFSQFVLAVPMSIGTTDGMSVYGVGAGLGLRLHAGSALPTQGMSKTFNGFYLEGRASINYQKATQKIPEQCGSTACLGPQEPEDKSFSLQSGGHAGYELMYFGDVEANESGQRRQSGYGFSLGFFAGYFSSFGNLASSAMYGPVIGFGRSEYDPVTGRIESLKLDFMVLPMPTFTQYTFGVTAAFG